MSSVTTDANCNLFWFSDSCIASRKLSTMSVILETTLGDIVIDLFTSERPRACLNFLKLCKIKYYNYCLFHSVEQNFMAQTGDPSGSGRGGESVFSFLYGEQAKYFEMETKPQLKHKTLGTVSMVNGGTNMLGSQFFITLADNLDYLDGVHTVFGEVVEGHEVLEKMNEAICDDQHRPYQDIRISHTVIVDDPFDDPPGLSIPDRSPEPTKEQLESGRIGADEEIDDTKDKTSEEIQQMISERELKAGTQILEMIGDIPDADVKPPDNVLFVCKLNPVTKDEDLEIIFSRFGQIKSCEVIRDQKNGESLQYAFIEFEKEEDCEKAYFKMDNVLIDDRRIHVDFSQSVSKVQWQKQGARPVIDKKENKAAEYAVKEKSTRSKYDLVFDDSGNGEDHKEGHAKDRKKKKKTENEDRSDDDQERRKRRNDSDHDDERGKIKRREKSEEEHRRYKERRRSAEREREKGDNKSKDHNSKEEDTQRKLKRREYREEPRRKEGKSHRRERESPDEGSGEKQKRIDRDDKHSGTTHSKDRDLNTSRSDDRDRKRMKDAAGSSRESHSRRLHSADKSSSEHRNHRRRDDH